MVVTVAQNNAFFTDGDQMSLNQLTFNRLVHEGIQVINDLVDFDEDSLKQVAENLRRPAGRMPDPTIGQAGGAAAGATIPIPPFPFGAKSHTRLVAATELLRFYRTIGRVLDAPGMRWDQVMRNFSEQWKAIKDAKKEKPPDVPTISKALPIIKWIEAFQDHCYCCIGHRMIPLAYVIREHEAVPALCPDRVNHQPYTEEHGSIIDDLINRASHVHGLYPKDNAEVYFKLEEATRSTSYIDSIKPFQRRKDGRGAYLAMVAQYAGTDKWEAEIKKANAVLLTRRWKGTQNFTLEKFVSQHRNSYVTLQACAEHVEYQLPNAHSRVGYILDAIDSDDAPLQAAMANINDDTGPNGKRGDFEAAVAYLLPKDPVVKRKQDSSKRSVGEISDTTADVSGFGTKEGIGKTGVHLRYHKNAEYNNLTKPQQQELREWRAKDPKSRGKPGKGDDPSKKLKTDKQIAAAIKKGIETSLKDRQKLEEKSEEGVNLLMEVFETASANAGVKKKAANASTAEAASSTRNVLKDILKKAVAASTKG
jgi:hypothetical protein